MGLSIQGHGKEYGLSFGEVMLATFTLSAAPYAMRHEELSEQKEYADWRIGHKILMVVQCIPGIGLLAGMIERIAVYVASKFKEENKVISSEVIPQPKEPVSQNEKIVSENDKADPPKNNEIPQTTPILPLQTVETLDVVDPKKLLKTSKLEERLKDLEEYALTQMSPEEWQQHCEIMKKRESERNKTDEELELECFTDIALKVIKAKAEKEKCPYIDPNPEQLSDAIESIKRDKLIDDLHKRENEDRENKLDAFYKSKGENYAKTPLMIDVASFQDKKVNGVWPIDLDQVAVDDWGKDKDLDPVDLDSYIDKKRELKQMEDEEGRLPPNPPLRISFRKAIQYIANRIEHFCKNPLPDNPRLAIIRNGSGGGIAGAITNIDFIPADSLTGKGRISWEDAIFLMLKQEGYVFDVPERGGQLFAQV